MNDIIVFDLDGTLYNEKYTNINNIIRTKVIHRISINNNISIKKAKKVYKSLPNKYHNPYYGLSKVNVSEKEYKDIFDSVVPYIDLNKDLKLKSLLTEISNYMEIGIVTFSSKRYAVETLKHLGINNIINTIICADYRHSFNKKNCYLEIMRENHINSVIGNDYFNDILPARELSLNAVLVNNNTKEDIYNCLKKVMISQ